METIDLDELKAKLDRGDDFKLVMTLNAWAFDASHIPGSINITSPTDAQKFLSPEDEIVVYCTNPACVSSMTAYNALRSAGYINTRRYAGGIEDWMTAGYPIEGSAAE